MAKKEELKISIRTPFVGFLHKMQANRFSVKFSDTAVFCHFGFVDQSGVNHKSLSVAFGRDDIMSSRDKLLKFIEGSAGVDIPETPIWHPSSDPGYIIPVRHIHAARLGDNAEILLHDYSYMHQVTLHREKKAGELQIEAEAIALIRCTAELQTNFIKEVYSGADE